MPLIAINSVVYAVLSSPRYERSLYREGLTDVTKEQMNDTGDLDCSAMADEAVCIGGRREDSEERMDDQIGHHQAQRESARSSREREVA